MDINDLLFGDIAKNPNTDTPKKKTSSTVDFLLKKLGIDPNKIDVDSANQEAMNQEHPEFGVAASHKSIPVKDDNLTNAGIGRNLSNPQGGTAEEDDNVIQNSINKANSFTPADVPAPSVNTSNNNQLSEALKNALSKINSSVDSIKPNISSDKLSSRFDMSNPTNQDGNTPTDSNTEYPLSKSGGVADKTIGGIQGSGINKFIGDITGGASKFDPTGIVSALLGTKNAPEGSTATTQAGNLINNLLGMGEKVLGYTPVGATVVEPAMNQFGKSLYGTTSGMTGTDSTSNPSNAPIDTTNPDGKNIIGNQPTINPALNAQQEINNQIQFYTKKIAQMSKAGIFSPVIRQQVEYYTKIVKDLQDQVDKQTQNVKNIETAKHSFGSYQAGTPEYQAASGDAEVLVKTRQLLKSLTDAAKKGDPATFEALAMQASDFEKLVSSQRVTEDQRQLFIPIVKEVHGLISSGNVFLPQNIAPTYKSILGIYDTAKTDFNRHAIISGADRNTRDAFLATNLDNGSGVEHLRQQLEKGNAPGTSPEIADAMQKYMKQVYYEVGTGMALQTAGNLSGLVKGAGEALAGLSGSKPNTKGNTKPKTRQIK